MLALREYYSLATGKIALGLLLDSKFAEANRGREMSSVSRRRGFCAAIVALSVFLPGSTSQAQDASTILGLFGGVVQAARADAARQQWQRRPVTEYDCVASHGTSVDALAAAGIGPSDFRVRQIITECNSDRAIVASPAEPAPVHVIYNPHFVVDGLALGGTVHFESEVYRSYSCRPSDQFTGFTWCRRKSVEQGKFGQEETSNSILHSEAGSALYVSKSIAPAIFHPGDIDREIARISQNFGLRARVLHDQTRAGFPKGVIATWGEVTLTPLDESAIGDLQRGQSPRRGFLFDFLDNERQSAKEGLPVYQIGGGAGPDDDAQQD